jgi:hypothetical protein
MSQQKEERARQKFSEKMRQKSQKTLTDRNAKLAARSADEAKAAPIDADAGKKD